GAPLRTNVQESYRAGVELEAQYRIARPLQLVSNLTLADHRIRRFDEVIYDYTSGFEVVVVEHRDTPIAFSPRIVATVGGVMRFGENRTKSADSGRAVSSFWELSWMQRYVGQQHLDNTGNEAVVLGAYTTGDAMLAYVLEDNRGVSLRINLWVNNVLDAQYSSNGYTFSYIFGERITERFYYPQAGRNVMIGLNLGF
ncbi:MAG: TonB-dependent receptor domain-containing protein, partial [Bacteroidota bacterium]